MSQATNPAGATRYLTFQLSGLEYALDHGKVQELRQMKSLERFAADGAIIKGVAVSRGVIMPIVDMRIASAGVRPPLSPEADVIILALSQQRTAELRLVGVVVDGVTDAVWLDAGQVAPVAGAAAVDYLVGIGQCGARRLILIDIDKLMAVRAAEAPGGARPRLALTR